MLEFLKDLFGMVKERKSYFMIPIIVALFIIGGLLIFAETSVLAPFIYTIF